MTTITLVRLIAPSHDGSHRHMYISCSSSEVGSCNILQVPETLALEGHKVLCQVYSIIGPEIAFTIPHAYANC